MALMRLFDLLLEEAVRVFVVPIVLTALGLFLVTRRRRRPSFVRKNTSFSSPAPEPYKVSDEPTEPAIDDDIQERIIAAQTQAYLAKVEAEESKEAAAEQVAKAVSEMREAIRAKAEAERKAKRLSKLLESAKLHESYRPPTRSTRSLWRSASSKRGFGFRKTKSLANLEEATTDTEVSKQAELIFELGPEFSC